MQMISRSVCCTINLVSCGLNPGPNKNKLRKQHKSRNFPILTHTKLRSDYFFKGTALFVKCSRNFPFLDSRSSKKTSNHLKALDVVACGSQCTCAAHAAAQHCYFWAARLFLGTWTERDAARRALSRDSPTSNTASPEAFT